MEKTITVKAYVGDHEQTGLVGQRHDLGERPPARRSQALEAGELRLEADAGTGCCVDHEAAVLEHGARGTFGGAPRALGSGRGGRPQGRRVGIESEHDLRLATLDGVAEALREAARQRTACLRRTPGVNRGTAVVGTSIRSPVRGFTPARPVYCATWNLPKPVS